MTDRKPSRTRLTPAEMLARLKAAAAEQGYVCEATEWAGGDANYILICAAGHRFERAADHVLYRHNGCAECTRDAIKARLQQAAQARGGEYLSETYLGRGFHHQFRCAHGHEWTMQAGHVLNGLWCRQCRDDARRLGIDVMRELARKRGGRCLSDSYVNAKTKLTWECHQGHIWEAVALNVTRGSWCPQCAILNRVRARSQWKRKRYEADGKTPAD